MATQYICPNKECNPLFPMVGKVHLSRKRIPERDEVRCAKCKHRFKESEMGEDGKQMHKENCGGELKQSYIYILVCPKCNKEN